MMKPDKSRWIEALIIILSGIAFYSLTISSPRYVSDDAFYSYIGGMSLMMDDADSGYVPVGSFADAVRSQTQDYFRVNGRFIAHSIVSYFCGVLGYDAFHIFNTLMFLLLVCFSVRIMETKGYNTGRPSLTYLAIITGLLFLMPVPAQIFWGQIAFSVNYLWSSAILSAFVYLLLQIKDRDFGRKWLIYMLIFVFSVFCGAFQESFSVAMSGALFMYFLTHRKEINKTVSVLVSGYWIGTAAVTFAPANFIRFVSDKGANDISGIVRYFSNLAHIFIDSAPLALLTIALVIMALFFRKRTAEYLKHNQLFCHYLVFAVLMTTVAYTGKHQLTGISLVSIWMLAEMFLMSFTKESGKAALYTEISLAVLLIGIYIPIHGYRTLNGKEYNRMESVEIHDGTVEIPDYQKHCIDMAGNWLSRRFTLCYYAVPWLKDGMSLRLSDGQSKSMVKCILPQTMEYIVGLCNDGSNMVKEDIFHSEEYGFYVIRSIRESCPGRLIYKTGTNFLGKIKNKVFGKSDLPSREIPISQTDSFEKDGYIYHIFIDNPERPVVDIIF